MEFLNYLWRFVQLATIMDVIDILIVSYVLYKLIKLIRHTSAERLLKGVLLLIIALQISDWLELSVVYFILSNMIQLGFLAVVIIFQPELRKFLEQFGKSRLRLFKTGDSAHSEIEQVILQTVDAVKTLSWSKTGALIAFERDDDIRSIANTGTPIDAVVSAELLKNIFFPRAALHDGAVLVINGRLAAAGCLLPLSTQLNISKDLGTRHRAAVGMTESYDSICVVVSEETGSITLAVGGILKRHLAAETLERMLYSELMPRQEKPAQGFWAWLKGRLK